MSTTNGTTNHKVTRADIEAKLRSIRDGIEPAADQAKGSIATIAPLVAAVVMALAYMAGRRKGRQGRALIEIRRV